MDLKQLNQQYFLSKDMYTSVLKGLSSRLTSYQNGIMYLEVIINNKWKKSYDSTAYQLAHDWKNSFSSLENAIGCKVYIIDLRSEEPNNNSSQLKKTAYRAKKGILFRADLLN